jgi:hypothetical protein
VRSKHRNFWRAGGLSVVAVSVIATLSFAIGEAGAQEMPGPGGRSGGGSPVANVEYPAPGTFTEGDVAAQASQPAGTYWTPQRMAQAVPMSLPERHGVVVTGSPDVATAAASSTAGNKGAGENTANLPAITAGGVSSTDAPMVSTQVARGSTMAAGVYPSPFSRWEWFGSYLQYPQSAASVKVFFTQTDNRGLPRNFVCSGSVVRPGIIDTAGHCTNSGGQGNSLFGIPAGVWSRNVLLCPAFIDGSCRQLGSWGIQSQVADGGWLRWGDVNDDYGSFVAAAVGGNCRCQIHQATGYLGFCWGSSCGRDQHWIAEGYPAAAPFNGNRLQTNAGEWWRNVNVCGTEGCIYPAMVSQGNDLTGGASGGPWIVSFGRGNYVNGHNDWKFAATPLSTESPFYDQNWANTTNAACRIYNSTNCV